MPNIEMVIIVGLISPINNIVNDKEITHADMNNISNLICNRRFDN